MTITFIIGSNSSYANHKYELVKLYNDLSHDHTTDLQRVSIYYDLAIAYYLTSLDSCRKYVKLAIPIAQKNDQIDFLGRLWAFECTFKVFEHEMDSAQYYLKQSKMSLDKSKDQVTEMLIAANEGGIAHLSGEYDEAITKYFRFLAIAEETKDSVGLGRGRLWIGQVMRLAGMPHKSLDFHRKANHIGHVLQDSSLLCRNYAYMGYTFEWMGWLDSAKWAIKKSQIFQPALIQESVYELHDRAKQYFDIQQLDSAEYFYLKALTLANSSDEDYYIIESHALLAQLEFEKGNLLKAKQYCDSIKHYLITNPVMINFFLPWWAQLEETLGHKQKAIDLLQQYVRQAQKVHDEKIVNSIAEMESKYNLAIKENELKDKALKLTRQQVRNNYFIAGIFALTLLLAFVYNRFQLNKKLNRQKHKLSAQEMAIKEQRIKDLVTEKQLVAIKSMVQGQEEERSRIAKELHDGLGSALSTIKLSVNDLPNSIEKIQDLQSIQKTSDLVDKASNELRRISQDLMPTTLARFGLLTALEDYIDELNFSQDLNIRFQHFDVTPSIPQNLSLSIYRIVQELISNAMKHAQADEILVQIIQHAEKLHLTVEDNGIGFDTNSVQKGSGYENIKSRLTFHDGQLHIESQRDKGTTVTVQCSINTKPIEQS